jgi:hypothetical protein
MKKLSYVALIIISASITTKSVAFRRLHDILELKREAFAEGKEEGLAAGIDSGYSQAIRDTTKLGAIGVATAYAGYRGIKALHNWYRGPVKTIQNKVNHIKKLVEAELITIEKNIKQQRNIAASKKTTEPKKDEAITMLKDLNTLKDVFTGLDKILNPEKYTNPEKNPRNITLGDFGRQGTRPLPKN